MLGWGAVSATHTIRIELVALAIAVAFGDGIATAGQDWPWAIAHATGIVYPHTIVYGVTHAVAVLIGRAVAATYAEAEN